MIALARHTCESRYPVTLLWGFRDEATALNSLVRKPEFVLARHTCESRYPGTLLWEFMDEATAVKGLARNAQFFSLLVIPAKAGIQ